MSIVLTLIDYKRNFDTTDRRTLLKVSLLSGMPDKYITGINTEYENNIAGVKGL